MKNILVLLFVPFLSACNLPANQKVDSHTINPLAYSVGGGNKVVFLTDYYADYLKGIKAGYKNSDSLYKAKVQTPILKNYFYSCVYYGIISYYFNPIQDTTGLGDRISIINSNREKIEKIITSTLVDCNKYLKNDSLTVYIQPLEGGFLNKKIKRMGGIAGVTGGSKQIMLTIDPAVNSWSDKIAFALAHEYNHAYWTKMNFNKSDKWDMLSYLVFEGRADSYAHFLYPNSMAPWDTALSETEKTTLWDRIKPQLRNEDMYFQRAVMFGSNDFPTWGGYCLGYAIVQSALKNNTELTPEEWTNLAPEKILSMSDYKY